MLSGHMSSSFVARTTLLEAPVSTIKRICAGQSPDAPPTMEVRLQLFLELRPVFRAPGPKPTTTTTTTKPYDRRRRGGYTDPVPPEVERWCRKYLFRVASGTLLRVLVNPLWTCISCCFHVPWEEPRCSHPCDRFPSISYYHQARADLAAPGELSELEWFAESPKWPENLTIPAGFLFDIPDLRNLLSTAERQRVQDFKETVDEEIVPPENVSVTDGDCPVPFAIGGGCKCKEGCGGCSKAGCTATLLELRLHIGHEPFLRGAMASTYRLGGHSQDDMWA